MNKTISVIRVLAFWLALCLGMGAANADSNPLSQLQERFPDSIKIHTDKRQSLEFCPDNTCDLFVTKRSTSVRQLSDFALLYLFFFSDYFVLADWRAEDAAKGSVAEVLKKYQGDKCANNSDEVTAQCLLRNWAARSAIRLYWVRFDERGRHLQARSIREATKLK